MQLIWVYTIPMAMCLTMAICQTAHAQNVLKEKPQPPVLWEAGAITKGMTENGHGIGVLSGKGKLDYHVWGRASCRCVHGDALNLLTLNVKL